jgi:hypothetical protein
VTNIKASVQLEQISIKVIHSLFPETFQDTAQNISAPRPAEKKSNTPMIQSLDKHQCTEMPFQLLNSEKILIRPRYTKCNNCL